MEREFLTRFLLISTRFLAVLSTRNEVKNQGGCQGVEKEFMTRFLLVTMRFLALVVLTTRNEVKNEGGQNKRIHDEVPLCHHEIPCGAHHEERGEKTWGDIRLIERM